MRKYVQVRSPLHRLHVSSTCGWEPHIQFACKRRGSTAVTHREIMQERKVSIYYVPTEHNISDLGTKFLNKHRHRYLIRLIKEFRA